MTSRFAVLRKTSTLGLFTWALFATGTKAESAWKEVQFGGFASQGYLVSSANDYFGETSSGTFDYREAAVNASWSRGRWRLGGQAFEQRIGDYGHDQITLDWATVDYQAAEWFGVRVGRVKTPRGLYNEMLDLDSVRPFVLLPQGVYDARLRDFNAAFNGVLAYGSVSFKQAGSFDYKAYYGDIPIKTNAGAADYFGNGTPATNDTFGMSSTRGGTLFWNTPLAGLRVGYSYGLFQNLLATSAVHLPDGTTVTAFKGAHSYERHLWSAEYSLDDWIFAAEFGQERALYGVGFPGAPAFLKLRANSEYYYFSAARRLNTRFECGAYFSHYLERTEAIGGISAFPYPRLAQDDYTISLRYDVNAHLLFKIEGHYFDGSGKVFDTISRPQPANLRENSWTMLALKTTLSF